MVEEGRKDLYYLSTFQVAQIFNIHVNTLKRIPPSELPFLRVCSRGDRRYSVVDIQDFIDRRTAK